MIKILILLFTFSVFAMDLDECMQQTDQADAQNQVNPLCFDIIKKKVFSPKLKFVSDDIELYAYKNVLLIKHIFKESNKKYIVAGSATQLEEILQVTFYEDEVFVLNKTDKGNKIFVFRSKSHGPVGPARVIDTEVVKSSRRFQVGKQGLHILTGDGQKIVHYSVSGDSRVPTKQPVKGKEIEVSDLDQSFIEDFSFVGSYLFIIGADSAKPLRIFDWSLKQVQSAGLVDLGMQSLRWIEYQKGNEYFLYDANAKKFIFEIN